MCGEDGTQKVIYKLKEEHAKGDENIKEKRKGKTEEEEREKQKNCIDYKRKTDCCASSGPSIYIRVKLFIPQKLI